MGETEKRSNTEQSMRVLFPKLYNQIVTELEGLHIHPYDIQTNIVEEESYYKIILRFGEGFTHMRSELFSLDAINRLSDDITIFIKETGEACKEVMIADYYKMMKM